MTAAVAAQRPITAAEVLAAVEPAPEAAGQGLAEPVPAVEEQVRAEAAPEPVAMAPAVVQVARQRPR